jgi:hypothetical protein
MKKLIVFTAGLIIGLLSASLLTILIVSNLFVKIYYNSVTAGVKSGIYFSDTLLVDIPSPVSTVDAVTTPIEFNIDKIDDYWVNAITFPLYSQRTSNTEEAYCYRAIILLSEAIPYMSPEASRAAKVKLLAMLAARDGRAAWESAQQAVSEVDLKGSR